MLESPEAATKFERQILAKLHDIQASIEARIHNRTADWQAGTNHAASSGRRSILATTIPEQTTPRAPRTISRLSDLVGLDRTPSAVDQSTPKKCSPRIRWPVNATATPRAYQQSLKSYIVIKPITRSGASTARSSTRQSTSSEGRSVLPKDEPIQQMLADTRQAAVETMIRSSTEKQKEHFNEASIKAKECHLWPTTQACNACRKLGIPCMSRVLGNVSKYATEKCVKCWVAHRSCDDSVVKATRRLRREVVTLDDLEEMNESS